MNWMIRIKEAQVSSTSEQQKNKLVTEQQENYEV